METIQQFSIKEDGFKEIRMAIIKRTTLIFLFLMIVGTGVNLYNANQAGKDFSTAIIMIPIMFVLLSVTLYTSLKRQEEIFQSYLLTIGPGFIRREQKNTPDIIINLSEVKEISKSRNGAFIIKGSKTVDMIIVPAQIKEYAIVEELLNTIKPVDTLPVSGWLQTFYKFSPFVMIIAMVSFYAIANKILVAILGISLLSVMIYSLFEIWRSKNFDNKIKQTSWISLIVIASILFTLIHKLFYL